MNTGVFHFSKVEHNKIHTAKFNSGIVFLKEHSKTSVLLVRVNVSFKHLVHLKM